VRRELASTLGEKRPMEAIQRETEGGSEERGMNFLAASSSRELVRKKFQGREKGEEESYRKGLQRSLR